MPPLKFTEVLSFSSEDPNHPATNMLSAETFRKWRCTQDSCGKQATVILKLERLSSIHSVDIGNNGSAFVEVLVAREGVDYQVLLVASSFMTPGESRNSSDTNRVRMFGPDKLNKNIAEQKWDRVKVICTQPFNKTLQFGLSFITVTAPSEGSALTTPKVTKLGSFTLKDEEEEDPISVGSVFARRKEKETASPLTGAAAIRAASASAVSSGSTPDSKKSKPITNAPDVGFYQLKKNASPAPERPKAPQPSTQSSPDAHEERGKEKRKERDRDSDKHRERDKRSKDTESRVDKEKETPKKDGHSDRNSSSESNKRKNDSTRDLKRTSSQESKQTASPSSSSASSGSSSKRKTAPFASLLKGVTFVLSGYQNPLRSQIRDMMLEMGARYKPEWEPSCTHLICAFAKTPKYQQVKGKGKIVTAKWISDCHKNKIRYPWRRYALPKQDNARESEEEIWAEELLPKEEKPKTSSKPVDSDVEESKHDKESNEAYSDNEDTDDEIERVLAKQKNTKNTSDEENVQKSSKSTSSSEEPPNKKVRVETSDRSVLNTTDTCKAGGTGVKRELNGNGNEDSVYDDDTDIDEENVELVTKPDTSSLPLPTLGDYLKGKCLFIYGNMSSDMKHLLGRYIIAFDGVLEEYMTEKVNFVITEDEWDDNFDNALADNPSLQFVKPAWIWRCSDKQKLVPFQPFMVVPRD